MSDVIERTKIAEWMNRSRFIHIEDALEFGKLRFFMGEYERGNGAKITVYHFMDLKDARVVFSDLANGKAVKYEEYKGKNQVSRILKIKETRETYWIQVSNGPGITTAAGISKPAGPPTAEVSVGLPVHDARALAHTVLAYLRMWEVRQALGVVPAVAPPPVQEVREKPTPPPVRPSPPPVRPQPPNPKEQKDSPYTPVPGELESKNNLIVEKVRRELQYDAGKLIAHQVPEKKKQGILAVLDEAAGGQTNREKFIVWVFGNNFRSVAAWGHGHFNAISAWINAQQDEISEAWFPSPKFQAEFQMCLRHVVKA